MSRELGPYSLELAQIRESYATKVTQLSDKATLAEQTKPNLPTRIFEAAVRRFHIPWYQDAPTRTKLALSKAQGRLNFLESIHYFDVKRYPDGGWNADIRFVDSQGAEDEVNLSLRFVRTREYGTPDRWSYRGRSKSGWERIFFNPELHLSERYKWIVEETLSQRDRNNQAEIDAQRTKTLS